MNELFNHTDHDGDQTTLFRHAGFPWSIRVKGSTGYLDREALERLSAAILSELADTQGTAPEGPAGASTPSTPKRDCVCDGGSTRRAQALVAASRTGAATAGSADVIAVAQDFEQYLRDGTAPAWPVVLPEPLAETEPVNETDPALCTCGHALHGSTVCGRPVYATHGPVMKCRCEGPDVPVTVTAPVFVLRAARADRGHTGARVGCPCGNWHVCSTPPSTPPTVAPAHCRVCTHAHVQGNACMKMSRSASGRTVVCGCLQ